MKTSIIITIISAALFFTGCNKAQQQTHQEEPKGELTRELAAKLLNTFLAQPSISTIEFSDSGFQKAEQDMLITNISPFWSKITDKGMPVFGSLLPEDDSASAIPSRNFDSGSHVLRLKSKLAEKVTSIDGIADAENGRKLVEFTTDYLFPANTPSEITQYVYSGRKAKAVFVLYDDGWRIIEK